MLQGGTNRLAFKDDFCATVTGAPASLIPRPFSGPPEAGSTGAGSRTSFNKPSK